jgi:DnaJ family protein C protein 16
MDAKNEDCKAFKDEYVLTAEKLYGIINVAAIDCGKEEELCNEEFGVFDIPQVMIYTEKTNEEGERFRGEMKQPHISRAATRKMQSFVSIVSGSNYDSFVDRDRWTKNKVMLFNDKKVTPSVYKAHSKKFLGKLDFAETRHTEADLVAKFGIETFPTLLVLTDHESYVGEKYEGEMKPD